MTRDEHSAPVWFITGCSTGFGRELSRQLLERGDRVVVTARNPASVDDLARIAPDRALVLPLDVTVQAQVDAAVPAALERFGRIDILVNNAGIGYFGAIEESDEREVRRMFEINVFGLAAMTRAVLPELGMANFQRLLVLLTKGSLSVKFKEAVMTALAEVNRCDYCVSFHATSMKEAGASEDERIAGLEAHQLEANLFQAIVQRGPQVHAGVIHHPARRVVRSKLCDAQQRRIERCLVVIRELECDHLECPRTCEAQVNLAAVRFGAPWPSYKRAVFVRQVGARRGPKVRYR